MWSVLDSQITACTMEIQFYFVRLSTCISSVTFEAVFMMGRKIMRSQFHIFISDRPSSLNISASAPSTTASKLWLESFDNTTSKTIIPFILLLTSSLKIAV